MFEDCAHWWALAQHCLVALDAIHDLQLVHLDLKADNVCIPVGPADFDPEAAERAPATRDFERIALIDFAFSLVSRRAPRQRAADRPADRLRLPVAAPARGARGGRRGNLWPTRQLDWRCDLYSLAAMLRRYLPEPEQADALRLDRARAAARRARWCAACSRRTTPSCRRCGRMPA